MVRLRIALFFLTVCMCSASMGFGFTCKEAERNALLKFKHSFIGKSNPLRSWVGQDCCSWSGVGCDNVTGSVIKLVPGTGLESYSFTAREVNPALLELKYLRYLDLSLMDFNGSRIPEFIGSMRQLQHLYLSVSNFGGKVPQNLGNLTELVELDLYFACFSGEMESTYSLAWVFKLENLKFLDLSYIDLSQAPDSLNILYNLPSLSVLNLFNCGLGNSHLVLRNSTFSSSTIQELNLANNLFSGPIPHFIQNLSSITSLDLSHNHFSSSIPSWLDRKVDLINLSLVDNFFSGSFPHFIQNSSSLTYLDLSYNQFSSSIPSWLANIRHLQYLSLNNNQFNCVDGGIINIIGHLCSLTLLDLSNNHLQEEIQESNVYNFSKCSRYDLEGLYLQNNSLSGQLPTIGSMSSLKELDLSDNNFEIIPASFGKLWSLEHVHLSYNHLSVVRQANLANLTSLKTLDVSSNSLTLDISPDWLPPFQLETLHILPCKLNSSFPKWLLSQENIPELDLSDTGLFGPLPDNIGITMPFLRSLRLANNHINGSIPRSLCELSLWLLDLHKNWLSGMIPNCWGISTGIVILELSSNRLSGPIPDSLTKVVMLQLLSLNNNLLEGEIPLSWSKCVQLLVLDMGKNNLYGEIPAWKRSDVPSLQILILRGNKFNGVIPPQLCSVLTLQIIDLANNNLDGTIPQCFGNFTGMGSINPDGYDVNASDWSAVEVIKGKEREYNSVLLLLVNMDLSCNNFVGVIPSEITRLSLLLSLNLSYNHLMGTIPKEIGKMKHLESFDLSHNNLSGPIPESISLLNYLSTMDLSFNNLQGKIPTGSQLQVLNDPSIYTGNADLCGDPLPKKCSGDGTAQSPTLPTGMALGGEGEDNKHEKMWLYLVIMLGFATGFWGVIGILVVKRSWRHAYFHLAEEIADWSYVRVAVWIARANGGS